MELDQSDIQSVSDTLEEIGVILADADFNS
jgi:hypothetical protein